VSIRSTHHEHKLLLRQRHPKRPTKEQKRPTREQKRPTKLLLRQRHPRTCAAKGSGDKRDLLQCQKRLTRHSAQSDKRDLLQWRKTLAHCVSAKRGEMREKRGERREQSPSLILSLTGTSEFTRGGRGTQRCVEREQNSFSFTLLCKAMIASVRIKEPFEVQN
jgi:hypothetical protein